LVDEKYPDFSPIGGFVQSVSNCSSKNYPIYFKFGQLAKMTRKYRSVDMLSLLEFDAAI